MYELKKYDHEFNDDGELVIKDVPIFAEAEREQDDGTIIKFDREFCQGCIDNAQARYNSKDKFMGPFHIEHNATEPTDSNVVRENIGRFLPTRLEAGEISEFDEDDNSVKSIDRHIVFADLVILPEFIDDFDSGKFPFLSVEINSPTTPEFSSLAALTSRPPQHKFEPFSIENVPPILPVMFHEKQKGVTRFYFSEQDFGIKDDIKRGVKKSVDSLKDASPFGPATTAGVLAVPGGIPVLGASILAKKGLEKARGKPFQKKLGFENEGENMEEEDFGENSIISKIKSLYKRLVKTESNPENPFVATNEFFNISKEIDRQIKELKIELKRKGLSDKEIGHKIDQIASQGITQGFKQVSEKGENMAKEEQFGVIDKIASFIRSRPDEAVEPEKNKAWATLSSVAKKAARKMASLVKSGRVQGDAIHQVLDQFPDDILQELMKFTSKFGAIFEEGENMEKEKNEEQMADEEEKMADEEKEEFAEEKEKQIMAAFADASPEQKQQIFEVLFPEEEQMAEEEEEQMAEEEEEQMADEDEKKSKPAFMAQFAAESKKRKTLQGKFNLFCKLMNNRVTSLETQLEKREAMQFAEKKLASSGVSHKQQILKDIKGKSASEIKEQAEFAAKYAGKDPAPIAIEATTDPEFAAIAAKYPGQEAQAMQFAQQYENTSKLMPLDRHVRISMKGYQPGINSNKN